MAYIGKKVDDNWVNYEWKYEDWEADEPETETRIDVIRGLLNNLLQVTEKQETDEEKAEKLKFRINKILVQLNKLQLPEDDDDESGSESGSESESESEWDIYDEQERELERKFEPIEEPTVDSNNPFRFKRPKMKGEFEFPCAGYHVLYEPSLNGNVSRTVKNVRNSANLAINSFNEEHKTEYSLVDVLGAIAKPCAGCLVHLGFTAIQPGDVHFTSFRTRIYYGIGKTQVDYVHIDLSAIS